MCIADTEEVEEWTKGRNLGKEREVKPEGEGREERRSNCLKVPVVTLKGLRLVWDDLGEGMSGLQGLKRTYADAVEEPPSSPMEVSGEELVDWSF